jgi:UDP-N-acetylglucosamine--dolichyl-phosphate N-acetylglucosaminephosphotransferase
MVAAFGLGAMAYITGSNEAMIISLSLGASLAAFMYYNYYPASILPGDSLTYLSGAALFSTIVIGNMEKFGVFIFAPWIIEFLLKLRSGFQAHSWGDIQEDSSLRPRYEKNYSLTHPLMRRGFNEKQITQALVGLEVVICVIGLLIFGPLGLL